MIFPLLVFRPRREESKFPIVTIIRQPHLWADKKYLLVVNNDTAVVNHVLVHHGPWSIGSTMPGGMQI
jgi:hypothetical protein